VDRAGALHWFAEIAHERFLVGREVELAGRRGLMLCAPPGCVKYDPDQWRNQRGVWADMIAVAAAVEGAGDLCTLNTYDRAGFTFGLMQWAAHTPGDNLVLLLRRLLALPGAATYFPDLALENGSIARGDP
jgi:hypothetical protein